MIKKEIIQEERIHSMEKKQTNKKALKVDVM